MSITTSAEPRADRRRAQTMTYDAPAWGTSWSPAQDAELLHGRGTLAARAARIGRTFYASQRRLQRLRVQAAQADQGGAQ